MNFSFPWSSSFFILLEMNLCFLWEQTPYADAEMKAPFLLTSTLTDDTRVSVVTNKTCLICGWKYFYRPRLCREHLGVGDGGRKHVQLWKSFPEHVDHHAQIVKDLKERGDHDKIQDR